MASAQKHKERSKRSYSAKEYNKNNGFIIIASHNIKNKEKWKK